MKKAIYLIFAVVAAVIAAGCSADAPGINVEITDFSFKNVSPVTAEISGTTVEVTVPYGTNLAALIATFSSTGVSVTVDGVEQVSGTTSNDFTSPVGYTVTAEDGSILVFDVSVTAALNPAKEIESFNFTTGNNSELSADIEGIINGNEINLKVDYSDDVADLVKTLVPTYTTTGEKIEVSSILQTSGNNSNDFTYPVIYKVTAEDDTIAEYTVNVYITVTRDNLDDMLSAEPEAVVVMADTSGITNMSFLFSGETTFNQDISRWNVSSVTNMSRMFLQAEAFNQYIGDWDVSDVTDMAEMFYFAYAFNQNIGSWDVSKVEDMQGMFFDAEAFNQDIGGWVVESVTDMNRMFSQAEAFNQYIGNWIVSNVTDMRWMFGQANTFNQNINDWDVSKVIDMDYMFYLATSFNQNLSTWVVNADVTHTDFSFNWGGGTEPTWP